MFVVELSREAGLLHTAEEGGGLTTYKQARSRVHGAQPHQEASLANLSKSRAVCQGAGLGHFLHISISTPRSPPPPPPPPPRRAFSFSVGLRLWRPHAVPMAASHVHSGFHSLRASSLDIVLLHSLPPPRLAPSPYPLPMSCPLLLTITQ